MAWCGDSGVCDKVCDNCCNWFSISQLSELQLVTCSPLASWTPPSLRPLCQWYKSRLHHHNPLPHNTCICHSTITMAPNGQHCNSLPSHCTLSRRNPCIHQPASGLSSCAVEALPGARDLDPYALLDCPERPAPLVILAWGPPSFSSTLSVAAMTGQFAFKGPGRV